MELNIVDKSENEWKRRAIFTWQKMKNWCVGECVCLPLNIYIYMYEKGRDVQQFISNENSLGCFSNDVNAKSLSLLHG